VQIQFLRLIIPLSLRYSWLDSKPGGRSFH